MSVLLVTLVSPMPRCLQSLFMAFLPHLPCSLALLSWLPHKTRAICYFWIRSCSPAFNCEEQFGVSHLALLTDMGCCMPACRFVSACSSILFTLLSEFPLFLFLS